MLGIDGDEYEDDFASGVPQGFIRARLGKDAVVTKVFNMYGFDKGKRVKMQVPIRSAAEIREKLKGHSTSAKRGGRFLLEGEPCVIVEVSAAVKAYKAVFGKEPMERGQRDAQSQSVLLSRLSGMEDETKAARAAAGEAAEQLKKTVEDSRVQIEKLELAHMRATVCR